MPEVIYVQCDGTRQSIEVPLGENVMRGALCNGVDGIAGECGGAPSCATCHCYIDEAWATRVGGPVNAIEAELLAAAASEIRPTSRLSCQIVVTEALDGVVIHLPETQY